jgi:tRNA A37 threonylcarbamoyladenosine modification protein TsaB
MAWLLIDSSDRASFRVAMIPQTGEILERASQGIRASVLAELHELIHPSDISSLSGIAVVYGPGSFSAIRSGVLIANLLSRLYHLPLYGFTKEEASNMIDIRRQLVSGTKETSSYVSPLYDAEPNITQKKVDSLMKKNA